MNSSGAGSLVYSNSVSDTALYRQHLCYTKFFFVVFASKRPGGKHVKACITPCYSFEGT